MSVRGMPKGQELSQIQTKDRNERKQMQFLTYCKRESTCHYFMDLAMPYFPIVNHPIDCSRRSALTCRGSPLAKPPVFFALALANV